ncbi:MAG: PspC domain-containing protein [Flavobacteriales bacterium]|nr:PspC domain-containing protein [Flavobacteriales bacterium]
MIERIRSFFEKNGFEVSSRLGQRIGVRADLVRLFFIYTSFATFGSPVILYLTLAFMMRTKDYLLQRKVSVFDL